MVFQIKGTRVNPLDTHPLRCSLLFLDGDNFNHVSWATNLWMTAPENSKPKLILVNGSPFELSHKHNLPVYFDQAGVLIKKLGIRQVPARVSQKNKILLVEEIEESVLQVDQTINLKENDQ